MSDESAQRWRPIATAPRDATAILVMRDIWPGTKSGRAEECNGHNTYVAQWWAKETEGTNDDGSVGRWVCYMDMISEPTCPVDPTHWMPLPKAPAERNTESTNTSPESTAESNESVREAAILVCNEWHSAPDRIAGPIARLAQALFALSQSLPPAVGEE